MKILLFVPAYNCERQLPRTLKKLSNLPRNLIYKTIVVNNQSTDQTLRSANQSAQATDLEISVVTNSANIGLGGTHKMAFQYALDNNLDGCIVLHGDDQGEISDIFKMNFADKCFQFGSRFTIKSKLKNYSKLRIFGNFVFNCLSSLICLKIISDFGGSGLNYFPSDLIRYHDFWKYPDDLTFHPFLLLNSIRLKQKIKFIPITWSEDDQISNVKLFSQTLKLFKILIKYVLPITLIDPTAKADKKDQYFWIQS